MLQFYKMSPFKKLGQRFTGSLSLFFLTMTNESTIISIKTSIFKSACASCSLTSLALKSHHEHQECSSNAAKEISPWKKRRKASWPLQFTQCLLRRPRRSHHSAFPVATQGAGLRRRTQSWEDGSWRKKGRRKRQLSRSFLSPLGERWKILGLPTGSASGQVTPVL